MPTNLIPLDLTALNVTRLALSTALVIGRLSLAAHVQRAGELDLAADAEFAAWCADRAESAAVAYFSEPQRPGVVRAVDRDAVVDCTDCRHEVYAVQLLAGRCPLCAQIHGLNVVLGEVA